jgi:hypothetical protein
LPSNTFFGRVALFRCELAVAETTVTGLKPGKKWW